MDVDAQSAQGKLLLFQEMCGVLQVFAELRNLSVGERGGEPFAQPGRRNVGASRVPDRHVAGRAVPRRQGEACQMGAAGIAPAGDRHQGESVERARPHLVDAIGHFLRRHHKRSRPEGALRARGAP